MQVLDCSKICHASLPCEKKRILVRPVYEELYKELVSAAADDADKDMDEDVDEDVDEDMDEDADEGLDEDLNEDLDDLDARAVDIEERRSRGWAAYVSGQPGIGM